MTYTKSEYNKDRTYEESRMSVDEFVAGDDDPFDDDD